MNQKGMTLIELMVVVAVVAILAAIAVPTYQDYVARARISEALMFADATKLAVTEHYVATGQMPNNNADLGLNETANLTTDTISGISIGSGGVITITLQNVGASMNGKALSLTPQVTGADLLTWKCTTSGEPRMVPPGCR